MHNLITYLDNYFLVTLKMEANITIFVIILLGALICFLVLSLLRKTPGRQADRNPASTKNSLCPICGSSLSKAEKVKSFLYPGKPDKIMHIFGCPFCYPAGQQRICPVCSKEIKKEGYLIARVFEKPGKTHVHVLGCTGCRKG